MEVKLYIKYFIFLYILAISSFEFFFRVNQSATYLLFPFVTLGIIYYHERINFSVIIIILPFVFVYIMQTILYGSPFYYAITLAIRLVTIYFSVKIIGIDFLKIFIQTIKIIALVSIVFYLLQYIGFTNNLMISLSHNITNLDSDPLRVIDRPNIIIYTIQTEKNNLMLYRNSGPFWEPGLYSVYLNIALFLNLFIKKRIFNKTNLLFILSIITAFSTMGTIALLINLSLFGLLNKSLSFPIRVLVFSLLITTISAISSLPFMTEKINEQIADSDVSYSRFGAAVVHFKIIKDYPLTGLPYDKTTYSKYADNISPNGITQMFVRYGIIAGFIYYIFLFRTSSTVMKLFGEKNKGYALFIILVIVLFSETQGNTPMYWAIIFSQIPLSDFLLKWNRFQKLRLFNFHLQKSKLNVTKI